MSNIKAAFEELPKGWITTSLFEIGELIKGVSYKKDEALKIKQQDYCPIIRANNIHEQLDFDDLLFIPMKRIKKEQLIKSGDIVLALSSGSKNLVGKAAQAKENYEIAFGAFCALIRLSELLNKGLYGYYFQSKDYRNLISELSSGVNINNLRREHLEQLKLFLPPLPEQHYIVAKLEELFTKLDVSVAELKKAKAQIKRYRQSVLKHAFEGKLTEEWRKQTSNVKGETAEELLAKIKEERKKALDNKYKELSPVDTTNLPQLPEGWVYALFTNTFNLSQGIQVPLPDQKFEYHEGFIRFLRIIDFTQDKDETRFVPHPGEQYVMRKEDVAMVRYGASTGFVCRGKEGVIANNLFRIQPIISECDKAYLFYFLNSPFVEVFIDSRIKGAAMPAISFNLLSELTYPLCCKNEQIEIVSEIERHFSVADETEKIIDQSLKQAERLRQSILKDAFSGKLVPQDPSDEPAEKLLERIKAAREKTSSKIKDVNKRKRN